MVFRLTGEKRAKQAILEFRECPQLTRRQCFWMTAKNLFGQRAATARHTNDKGMSWTVVVVLRQVFE